MPLAAYTIRLMEALQTKGIASLDGVSTDCVELCRQRLYNAARRANLRICTNRDGGRLVAKVLGDNHMCAKTGRTEQETTWIKKFIAVVQPFAWTKETEKEAYKIFSQAIRQISSPVDLYEHNSSFKLACDLLLIRLRWGTKVNRKFKHAYHLAYSHEEGCTFTVQTDRDLHLDDETFPWENYDLVEDEE